MKRTKEFIEFCRKNLELKDEEEIESYEALSVCILDCIYSLRAPYFYVTVPLIQRYANRFLDGNSHARETLSEFLKNVEKSGGEVLFASEVLKNNQKIGGELKSIVCCEIARKLIALDIESIEDFKSFENIKLLESQIRSVKGIGNAGINYLFMLAGDENRCKPDVHIHHCICDACGSDVSDDECQTILSEAVQVLKMEYSNLTVAKLDGKIWNRYQIANRK